MLNINEGVALTPPMVLYLLFFATAVGVAIIAVDPGDPDVMHRPPRDPKVPITNRNAVITWIIYAGVLFLVALVPLLAGPDEPSSTHAVGVTHHDLRRDGHRHRDECDRQPAGSGQRSRCAGRQGVGDRRGPGA